MQTFEERMKYIRGSLTMNEFAAFIGATQQKVSNYENGKVKPTFEIFENMARAGYNINWLLTGEGEMYSNTADNNKPIEFITEMNRIK